MSLASADGRSDGNRYKEWCLEHLSSSETIHLTGEDLWSIRCGVLHNGRFGDLKHNVARIAFVPAAGSAGNIFSGKVNDAYFCNVTEFCKNICDAVCIWYELNKGDPNVLENIPRLMQYYPQGLAPFIIGMPIIA